MKKRVMAIVLTLVMAVSFIPTFGFAAEHEVDPNVANLNKILIDALTKADVSQIDTEKIQYLADALAKIDVTELDKEELVRLRDNISTLINQTIKAINVLQGNDQELLDQYGGDTRLALEALAKDGLGFLDDYLWVIYDENPEGIDTAIAHMIETADWLNEKLGEYGFEKFENPGGSFEALERQIDVAKQNLASAKGILQRELLSAALNAVIVYQGQVSNLSNKTKGEIVTSEVLVHMGEIIKQAHAMASLIDAMKSLDAPAAYLNKLDQLVNLFAGNVEKVTEVVSTQENFLLTSLRLGTSVAALKGVKLATVADILSWVQKVVQCINLLKNGGSVEELEDTIDELGDEVETLKAKYEKTSDQLEKAEIEITVRDGEISQLKKGDDAFAKLAANAAGVEAAKPMITKVKSKKKKITVKWAKIAPQVTGYEVFYQQPGKNYKIKAVSADKLKAVTGKLKKGKKTTVKVRAVYTFQYKGTSMTVHSQWSKAKKVKVK